MKYIKIKRFDVIGLFAIILAAKPAFAYIDPNAGGLMFQLLAAIFAVFSVILLTLSAKIKMIFARFKRSVRNLFIKRHQAPGDTSGEPSAHGYKSPGD